MKKKIIIFIQAGLALIMPMLFFKVYELLSFFVHQANHYFLRYLMLNVSLIIILLGMYVVILKRLPHWLRRTIAYFHTGCGLIHLALYLGIFPSISETIAMRTYTFRIESGYIYFYHWFFFFAGLAFSMTYHGRIKELCPLQKTRMAILLIFPLISWLIESIQNQFFFGTIGLMSILNYGPTILQGLLLGIYVWVLERLTKKNKKTVLLLQCLLGIGILTLKLALMMAKVFWLENALVLSYLIDWGIFGLILLIFDKEFISNSHSNDNINP